MNDGSYILAFDSTNYAIAAEKHLIAKFNITVIPTPREITTNCGLSIKINDDDLLKIKDEVRAMKIPACLYLLGPGSKPPRSVERLMAV